MRAYSIEDLKELRKYYFDIHIFGRSPNRVESEEHYRNLYLVINRALNDMEQEIREHKRKKQRRIEIRKCIVGCLKKAVIPLFMIVLGCFMVMPTYKVLKTCWVTEAVFVGQQVDETENGSRKLFNVFEYKDGEDAYEIKQKVKTILNDKKDKPNNPTVYYNPNKQGQAFFDYEVFGLKFFVSILIFISAIVVAVMLYLD